MIKSISQLVVIIQSLYLVYSETLNVMTDTQVLSSNGYLETTITVDQYYYENIQTKTKFWTRAYNPISSSGTTLNPGPMLRFKRGDIVQVTLKNNLGPETETMDEINTFHYANVTNLHTHGLHVSADPPQDDVMIKIFPGSKTCYIS